MTYFAPSYLHRQGLLPNPKSGYPPTLRMSQITNLPDEGDEHEKERLAAAPEYRMRKQQQEQQEQEGNNNGKSEVSQSQ
jgi:hypothetical protein